MKGSAWESSRKGGVTCETLILRRSLWWPYTGKLRLDKTEYCLFRILEDILSFMKEINSPYSWTLECHRKKSRCHRLKAERPRFYSGLPKCQGDHLCDYIMKLSFQSFSMQ